MKRIGILCLVLSMSCTSNNSKKEESKTKSDSVANVASKTNTGFTPTNKTTGAYEDKHPNGNIKTLGYYRFGKKDGTWAVFYPTGQIWSENTFKNDSLNGATTNYYENGKKRYTGFYKSGKPSGTWQFFDSTGKFQREQKY
jgi:antitoxin component YwqK of YwqJK toxin-antitoxin module